MFPRVAFILSVSLTAFVLVFAGALDARESAPAAAAQEVVKLPEQLLQENCQTCHDLRPIQTAAKSADEWRSTIIMMIEENGAEVAEEDIEPLVRYLTLNHGPVPDAPGKEILLNTCTRCHDLQRIKIGRRSSEEWEETLIAMLNEGAPLSEVEFVTVHGYLSRYFGVD